MPFLNNGGSSGFSGTGTSGYLPKFTGTVSLGSSVIYENAGNVTIGSTTATSLFNVGSSAQFQVTSAGNVAITSGATGDVYSQIVTTHASGYSDMQVYNSNSGANAHYYANGSSVAGTVFGQSVASAVVFYADGGDKVLFGSYHNVPVYIGTNSILALTVNTDQSIQPAKRMLGTSAGITAANDLTLGASNQQIVSGATQINAITTTGWTAGSSVTLIFSGAPTVKHNTSGGGSTAPILLSGSVDFVASANSSLQLEFDGTYWQEKSRKVTAAAASGGGACILSWGYRRNSDLGVRSDAGMPIGSAENLTGASYENAQIPMPFNGEVTAATVFEQCSLIGGTYSIRLHKISSGVDTYTTIRSSTTSVSGTKTFVSSISISFVAGDILWAGVTNNGYGTTEGLGLSIKVVPA